MASGHVFPVAHLSDQPSIQPRKGNAKASETWAKGSVVIRSSGQLAEAAADPTADIVGFATHGVTSATANDEVSYVPATPNQEFILTLDDQSDQGTHVLAVTNQYVDYALQVDSDGIWFVDVNDTSNTGVVVTGLVDPVGTTPGRVRVRVLHDATIYNS